ncbi:hypothetical protein J4Q44_G00057660 [Coregonus suidteri]|uniref:Uncharacterized protein n=1 Tax=Coregonus suidteri TaxID=861788 RepID=A0AAN8MBJ5_9TELE
MSLPEFVTLDGDCDGGFGGPHNEEAGVPSSDVKLTLDLVPGRMVFTRLSGEAPRILDLCPGTLRCGEQPLAVAAFLVSPHNTRRITFPRPLLSVLCGHDVVPLRHKCPYPTGRPVWTHPNPPTHCLRGDRDTQPQRQPCSSPSWA